MKAPRSSFHSAALILGLGLAINSLCAETPPPRQAIIVIRHAEDAINAVHHTEKAFAGKPAEGQTPAVDPWPSKEWDAVTSEKWPDYPHPFIYINNSGEPEEANESGFRIALHVLSGHWQTAGGNQGTKMKGGKEGPLGEKQAISLGKKLDSLVRDGGFYQIGRTITMDPREEGSTPNPFDTLWPYLKERQLANSWVELYLVKRVPETKDKYPGIMSLIKNDKVLPANVGSTVICWTGEGLMGKKVNEQGEDGILARLIKKYRGDIGGSYDSWVNGPIERCADIFVFYLDANGKGVAEKWKFDYATGAFERKDRHADE